MDIANSRVGKSALIGIAAGILSSSAYLVFAKYSGRVSAPKIDTLKNDLISELRK